MGSTNKTDILKNQNASLKDQDIYVKNLAKDYSVLRSSLAPVASEMNKYEAAARAAGISQTTINKNKLMAVGGTGVFSGMSQVDATKALATAQIGVNKSINEGTNAQNAFMKAFNLQKIFGYFSAWQVFNFALQTLRDTLIELQNDMIRLESITGMTSQQAAGAFVNIKDAAMEAGFTIAETSKVYLEASRYSNNFSDAKQKEKISIDLTREALALSNITGQESAKSIEQLIGITQTWNMNTDEVRKGMDGLASVMQLSYANMSEMADALSKSGGILQNTGYTFSQAAGFVANLSQKVPSAGIAEITTAVGRVPEFLKSAEAEKAFKSFGISIRTVDQNGSLVFKDLKDTIIDINRALADGRISTGQYNELVTKIGGGARGVRFVDFAIKGMNDTTKLGIIAQNAMDKSTQANSKSMELSANTAKSLEKKLKSLYDAFQGFITSLSQTKIGNMTLVDSFGKLIDVINILFNALSSVSPLIGSVFSSLIIGNVAIASIAKMITSVKALGVATAAVNIKSLVASQTP